MANPFLTEIGEFVAAHLPQLSSEKESTLKEEEGWMERLLQLISSPPRAEMGDYALPCFSFAKELKRKPEDIAAKLAASFTPTPRILAAKAFGPYLNFFVNRPVFMGWVLEAVREQGPRYGEQNIGQGRTVVIDFSSPNIAKHLGIHHVRTTMIGNALANIFRALGFKVVGINFLGDWGTQFGTLIAACKRWGTAGLLEGDPVANLNALYVRFNQEAEKNPALLDEARACFKKLEDGDPEALAMWKQFREVSLAAFEEVYKLLGVKFDVITGESEYVSHMPKTIERLQQMGLAEESEGALIIRLPDPSLPPVLLRKSDGATLYDTRDIAAAEDRWNKYHFAKMIYVVGGDQKVHFRQLFKALELMGHAWAKDCVHVDFGIIRIRGEEGRAKMSSRRGQVIMLKDVLAEAIRRARALIEEKNPTLEDKEKVAEQVGIGAVVFADFKARRNKDVDFDWKEVLSFEGESGPYVQYTHVRLCSILRKHGQPIREMVDPLCLSLPEEHELAKLLAEFPQTIRRAAESYEPSMVATYLLDLCARVNAYYHDHRVLGDDENLTAARIRLVDSVRQVLANGMHLLGIPAPEQM